MIKHFSTWLILLLSYLAIVFLYGKCYSWFNNDLNPEQLYTLNQIAAGTVAEAIRAAITIWLFVQHKSSNKTYIEILKYSIMINVLVGSYWLILGYFFLPTANSTEFLINDGIILLVQTLSTFVVLNTFFGNGQTR